MLLTLTLYLLWTNFQFIIFLLNYDYLNDKVKMDSHLLLCSRSGDYDQPAVTEGIVQSTWIEQTQWPNSIKVNTCQFLPFNLRISFSAMLLCFGWYSVQRSLEHTVWQAITKYLSRLHWMPIFKVSLSIDNIFLKCTQEIDRWMMQFNITFAIRSNQEVTAIVMWKEDG